MFVLFEILNNLNINITTQLMETLSDLLVNFKDKDKEEIQ